MGVQGTERIQRIPCLCVLLWPRHDNLDPWLFEEETKKIIKTQAKRRLDPNLNFYLRFDKQNLLRKDRFQLTEQGDCLYMKLKIASYPKNESNALKIVYDLFE